MVALARWCALIILFASCAAGSITHRQEKALVFTGARIHTVNTGIIDRGEFLIQDGKFASVGPKTSSTNVARIDLTGKVVIPGLIDAGSDLLLETSDTAAAGAADRDVLDAVDWYDKNAERALRRGVTAAFVSPGSRGSIGGLGAVVKLRGRDGQTAQILQPRSELKLNLGVSDASPSTLERLSGYESLRTLFKSAEQYSRTMERFDREQRSPREASDSAQSGGQRTGPRAPRPRTVPAQEMILKALRREIPVRIEAHRAEDILNAARLAEEFKLRVIIEGAEEGPAVAGELSRRSIPVIWGPVLHPSLPGIDSRAQTPSGASKLARAGIRIALTAGGNSRFLLENAALAAGCGLSKTNALRAVTLDAARILGVSNRIGSIEKGKDADFVVLSGDPWRPETRIEQVYVNGERVYAR